MDETTFDTKWERERPIYDAWGKLLTSKVLSVLERSGRRDVIRVPPQCRIKTSESLIEKVFYRNPGKYSDPWNQIEDFVGIRFIVLLISDIDIVSNAIHQLSDVDTNVARDPREIERAHPNAFDYVSTHLICRPKHNFEFDGITISDRIPCEVQIRTFLQHAWSEISHSALYKPAFEASNTMKRNVAKSSALLEATADYFESVHKEIVGREEEVGTYTRLLTPIYRDYVGQSPLISTIEQQVLDAYTPLVADQEPSNVAQCIDNFTFEKSYIAERIRSGTVRHLVYKQPSILLIYWLVDTQPSAISRREFGLPRHILDDIYSDLGKSLQ